MRARCGSARSATGRNSEIRAGCGARSKLRSSNRYEHLARYVGWYSNRARGERAKKEQSGVEFSATAVEPMSEYALRAKAAWARLIRKVYEADPLECPKCASDYVCSS